MSWMDYIPFSAISMIVILVGMSIKSGEFIEVSVVMEKNKDLIFITTTIIGGLVLVLFVIYFIKWIIQKVITALNQRHQHAEALAQEREALIRFYECTNGFKWRDKTRWCSSEPVHLWHGIKINARTGRINKIILPENNLCGPIPDSFFSHFPYLNEVDLRMNSITGPIPADLRYCKSLQGLYLYENEFTGKIPDCLADLHHLSGIYLFNNHLEDIERSKELFRSRLSPECLIYI